MTEYITFEQRKQHWMNLRNEAHLERLRDETAEMEKVMAARANAPDACRSCKGASFVVKPKPIEYGMSGVIMTIDAQRLEHCDRCKGSGKR